ncbi:MAG: hypothetical protein GY793_06380 [Proteobacteria bacterium]|nr:hypothetical protein [Pseudomonadota bacterium]
MEYIKLEDLQKNLKAISLSNNDITRCGDGFEDAMTLVNKLLQAIEVIQCCESDSELLNGYELWKRTTSVKTENYTASTLIHMYLKTI